MRVTSKLNGNQIFLPAAGFRRDTGLNDAGSYGYYWCSSLYESDFARLMLFFSSGVYSFNDNRFHGQSIRPVTE